MASTPAGLATQTMNTTELLRHEADRMRILNLKALNRAGSGHPGGTLSLAEVIATLYFGGVLRYDRQEPAWENRDRLVLSEGHSVPILYTALVEAKLKGWSLEALMDLRQNPDVIAQGHATVGTPGIDCSTGALGMGGSKALGMALAARYTGRDYHTFAIIGDGESEEGEIYEAASNAALLGVDNLTWILNRNKAQQTMGIHDGSSIKHEDFYRSLNWNVVVLNGESVEPEKNREFITKLRDALLKAKADAHRAGRPTIIIADTVKGKGVGFMEYHGQKPGEYKFHGVAPTDEQLAKALPEIEARLKGVDSAELDRFIGQASVSADEKRRVNETNAALVKERREKQMDLRKKAPVANFPAFKPTDKPTGTRVGFGEALASLAQQHPEIVATSGDLQDSNHLFPLEKVGGRHGKDNPMGAYMPEGISESNAAGKSAGLGMTGLGLIPIFATFDNFLLEAADELHNASAFGLFYLAVGTHSGCGVGPDGKSQMSEATPGFIDHCSGIDGELFEIYEPADAQEAAEITRLVVERTLREGNPGHPIYLRCTRHNLPILDRSGITDYVKKLQEGSYEIPVKGVSGKTDLILVASGATVHEGLQAAEKLATQGIRVKLINVVSLNKIQKSGSAFLKSLDDHLPIVTAHDAEPYALSHRVEEAINTARKQGRQPGIVQRALGVNVSPRSNHVGSGTSEENYRRNLLDAAGITQTIQDVLKK
jgi:transketolase